ncbi:MAG: HEAT repeat domain-containing protein [Myxococcales bacterium]|nr:HEAT repeat domain-containing protein [Myxococcales bacterium]
MLLRIFEMLLPVRRGERQLTFTLFLHSLFAVGAFLTGRTVRDALFLANCDRSTLAWMYVASAGAVTAAGLVYGRLATRLRRDVMALASAGLFAVLFVGVWLLERGVRAGWVYGLLYVYVEVMGALVLVQFWTLANELFNAREAKRLYGFIGAGGTMANILIGLLAAKVATTLGTAALLIMCAVLLGGAAAASYAGGRLGRQRMFARAASGKPGAARRSGGGQRVLADSHLRAVALLSAVTFLTTTLIDFEFKVVAADKVSGDGLAAFFGYFSAVVGVLALGLQLFGTSRLLNRIGVIGSLAVLPISLGLGSAALALVPALWAASMAKGADTLFRYSVNDATTQILYLPVSSQVRVSAKAFIDGVVKPMAIGVAGLLLAGYRHFLGGDPYRLAWLSLVLCAAWVAVVMGLRSKYLKSLQENLKQRRLDLESARHRVIDSNTNSVLERALASDDEQEVYNAVALLPHLEKIGLDHKVEVLLEHRSAKIREKALEYYAHRQTMRFANSVFRRFEDPDPAVRAAAVDAFCAMGRDKAVRSVRNFLNDADPRIRSAAVTGMIRFGGLDGVLVAAEALKGLIDNGDPVMRQHAARVLGAIGVKNFYQPVLTLMNDADLRVRREAVTAAGVLKSPEFVIPLIYRTQSRETLREATHALTAYGAQVIPTLQKVLANHLEDPHIRRAVARVLGRLGTSEAAEVIAQHLAERDEELRGNMYRSLARAVKGRRLLLKDLSRVRKALDVELERAYRALHFAQLLSLDAGPGPNTPRSGEPAARALLGSALKEKVSQVERRVFLLLAVLYPDADMEQIAAGIYDASATDAARRRGNAVELLDNLLDRHLKQRFLPLLEELPRADRLAQVVALFPPPTLTPQQALFELAKDEAAWVRACALWCIAEGSSSAEPDRDALLERAVGDTSAVVRELALVSLDAKAPGRAGPLAEQKLRDDAPQVRRQAALIASRYAALASGAG